MHQKGKGAPSSVLVLALEMIELGQQQQRQSKHDAASTWKFNHSSLTQRLNTQWEKIIRLDAVNATALTLQVYQFSRLLYAFWNMFP